MRHLNVHVILVALFHLTFSFGCQQTPVEGDANLESSILEAFEPPAEDNRIPVLNMGTFHFGYTTDARSEEFDEHSDDNLRASHEIAAQLAEFKPTVLLVENVPERDSGLQAMYRSYLQNPDTVFENPNEVTMITFELGRLAGVDRIYGIDHKMGYNYSIGEQMDNKIDSAAYRAFMNNPFGHVTSTELNMVELSLHDKLLIHNHPDFLGVMITINADILTHVGSQEGFEGADQAARYYQRNLRMYANMNRLDLLPDDRVFFLSGASHTAFFADFLKRSPKYRMVSALDYLNRKSEVGHRR